ncbi:MAG: hypothetical protein QOK19_1417, partial [Solirubrobacteraceae bacterium]|nr:hypothetical protein [Solirubrobacteraceae bacterium]
RAGRQCLPGPVIPVPAIAEPQPRTGRPGISPEQSGRAAGAGARAPALALASAHFG